MEPRIQYTKTEDGANIAYWTIGEGTPFILPSGSTFGSSLQAWRTGGGRALMERLAANRMLVRYDARGFGMSQGAMPDFTIDGRVRDLASVLDCLGEDPVILCGYFDSGPAVLTYAARHPERVSRIVLWSTSPRGVRFLTDETLKALEALAKADFELYVEAMAAMVLRALGGGEDVREYAESLKESMSPDSARGFLQAQRLDVTDILSRVQAPTLVLHRRGVTEPSMNEQQALATGIPNARLMLLEGTQSAPYSGDVDSVLRAIDDFLGEVTPPAAKPAQAADVHTILFTDLTSSTELTQRLGDEPAQELVRTHNAIVREALAAHGGSEIKHTGDGIMASFGSASGALECSIAIQRAFAQQDQAELGVHIGLNAGEPVAEDEDLFGTAVQLARRICDTAGAGEIFASNVVRELAAGKGYLFADRGAVALRGFEDPARVYEVRWRQE